MAPAGAHGRGYERAHDRGQPGKAAEIVGYASQPGFGAAFRGLFDMTPGQVRLSGRVSQPAAVA